MLDLVLPGADGIELMRTLPALADIPVIFVSACGRDETIAQTLEASAADYIVKPFSPAELEARVGVEARVEELVRSERAARSRAGSLKWQLDKSRDKLKAAVEE